MIYVRGNYFVNQDKNILDLIYICIYFLVSSGLRKSCNRAVRLKGGKKLINKRLKIDTFISKVGECWSAAEQK